MEVVVSMFVTGYDMVMWFLLNVGTMDYSRYAFAHFCEGGICLLYHLYFSYFSWNISLLWGILYSFTLGLNGNQIHVSFEV